jgi:hypothetical protein
MGMRAAIFGAILILLTAGVHRTVLANTFKMQDSKIIDETVKKILDAEADNLSAQQSLARVQRVDEAECLNEIGHILDSLQEQLSGLSTLVAISSLMITPYDETAVNGYLRVGSHTSMKIFPVARRAVNGQAAFCHTSAIVVTRAQLALSLLGESESIVSVLNRRL